VTWAGPLVVLVPVPVPTIEVNVGVVPRFDGLGTTTPEVKIEDEVLLVLEEVALVDDLVVNGTIIDVDGVLLTGALLTGFDEEDELVALLTTLEVDGSIAGELVLEELVLVVVDCTGWLD